VKANRVIAAATGGLTALLAGASFTLSFNSLTELAAQQGLSVPVLFPLILEGGLIGFSLTALTRSLQGQSTRGQWALVIGSSLTATAFNVLHAPVTPLARVMWAIPSVMLLLSFESVLTQLRYKVQQAGAGETLAGITRQTHTAQTELARLHQQTEAARAELDKLRQEREAIDDPAAALDGITERRVMVRALTLAGITQPQQAELLQVSTQTIKRDVKALNGKLRGVAQ